MYDSDYCNVTISANPGEYLDGIGVNGVVVTSNIVYTLQSDGIDNWYVISKSYGIYDY